jgi:hypothetical protein
MFEPATVGHGPSGLADWPRPFVFRASHLDGCTVERGAAFFFNLNLFDLKSPALAYLVLTFAQFAREGMGPRRGRAELVQVSLLDENGRADTSIFNDAMLLQQDAKPMELSLQPVPAHVERVRVHFVTPTEIKSGQQLSQQPQFGTLVSRIRDRVSTLRNLYDEGPLAIDFRAFGERAAHVRLTHFDIRHVEVVRQSSRTRQTHSIGGFVGEAEYEGELAEFIPYLRAAKWTGVGRQTVWGKGEVHIL